MMGVMREMKKAMRRRGTGKRVTICMKLNRVAPSKLKLFGLIVKHRTCSLIVSPTKRKYKNVYLK